MRSRQTGRGRAAAVPGLVVWGATSQAWLTEAGSDRSDAGLVDCYRGDREAGESSPRARRALMRGMHRHHQGATRRIDFSTTGRKLGLKRTALIGVGQACSRLRVRRKVGPSKRAFSWWRGGDARADTEGHTWDVSLLARLCDAPDDRGRPSLGRFEMEAHSSQR